VGYFLYLELTLVIFLVEFGTPPVLFRSRDGQSERKSIGIFSSSSQKEKKESSIKNKSHQKTNRVVFVVSDTNQSSLSLSLSLSHQSQENTNNFSSHRPSPQLGSLGQKSILWPQ